MADIPKMRRRARNLREQAKVFRKMGDKAHRDQKLHGDFVDLAQRCEEIADKIDDNIKSAVHRPGNQTEGKRLS